MVAHVDQKFIIQLNHHSWWSKVCWDICLLSTISRTCFWNITWVFIFIFSSFLIYLHPIVFFDYSVRERNATARLPGDLIPKTLSEAPTIRESFRLSTTRGWVNLLVYRIETIWGRVDTALEIGPRFRVEAWRLFHMLLPDAVNVSHISDVKIIMFSIHGTVQKVSRGRQLQLTCLLSCMQSAPGTLPFYACILT